MSKKHKKIAAKNNKNIINSAIIIGAITIVGLVLCLHIIPSITNNIRKDKIISIYKSLKLDELLEEMETIAASGTRLNLDYAIDEWLDEYEQEEIIDYFKSCETSSLDIAQKELSENDYSLEQLKIMRIKFLSVFLYFLFWQPRHTYWFYIKSGRHF